MFLSNVGDSSHDNSIDCRVLKIFRSQPSPDKVMVKLTDKQIRYIINQVVKHKKITKTMARLYGMSQRRVQQLVKVYRDTGEYQKLNPNRRPKTYLSEEEKDIIERGGPNSTPINKARRKRVNPNSRNI